MHLWLGGAGPSRNCGPAARVIGGRPALSSGEEVFDGGARFFHASYDPESRRVYDLGVNGES
jgi:hypothetical protein